MHYVLALIAATLAPQTAQSQIMGNMPHPVVMIAGFAKEIAVCEAAQKAFTGETLKYLLDVDRIAPGYLQSSQLQDTAQALVKDASTRDLSRATEDACRERIFPVAKRAIDALPCYATRDWKECPSLGGK